MNVFDQDGVRLHWREDGDPDGAPLVFANSLGTDLRLWDAVVPLLPQGLRIIRYDMRGHGLSDCPPAPYSMGTLVRDAERLIEHLGLRDVLFCGLSIGGLVAQGLACKRLDLVRAVVLSNTAARIGTPDMWATRIAAAREGGAEALADATMERWFPPAFRDSAAAAPWRAMFSRTPTEGICGCMAAISGTDFLTPVSGLRLPLLAIAGGHDGSVPPDMVRETADLVPGSEFALIRSGGHVPCVDQPGEYAAVLTAFIERTGHLNG